MEAPKSRRVRDVLPSIKPSFLSVVLVFFIGILWAKNEMTNERLSVLEEQMNKLTEARYVETGLITRHEGISAANITYRKRSARKIQIPVQKRFDQLPVLRSEEESRARYRRRAVTNTTGTLTIDQIRKEINKHFRNFTPLKYCRSNETVCPSGPPGLPGPRGTKGVMGPPGKDGKQGIMGSQGVMGPPGKDGKQGIMGPQGVMGPPGKNGKQGIMGPQGVMGPPGKDGKQGIMGPQGLMGPPGKDGKQGITGPQGVMGPPGKDGKQGIMGPQGVMGPPGNDGKQGIMGPPGTRGDKGNPGPKGIAGPVGPPGESISVPRAVMSPTEQTRDEGSSAIFYCTAEGNPKPTVEWRFKGVKLSSGSKYSAKEGELKITQLKYSDAGKYSCAVESLLGSAEVSGNLLVRGLPVFIQVPPSLVTPTEGTNLQQSCQAKGFPAPVLHWSRVIQPLPVGRTEVEQGNLAIRNLATVDSGLYECVASNSMGTRRSRMSIAVQKAVIIKDCDCWRSRSRNPVTAWSYLSLREDAIDFKADDVVTLRGYRLWGVYTGSGSYDVTIRLYQGDSLIAEKTGSYRSSSTDPTYEAFFSQEISLRAGLVYTAVAFIQGPNSFAHHYDGITSTLCSRVRVTFMKSSRDTNNSRVAHGQIPALIFRSSNC